MRSRFPWRPPSGELLPVLEREPGRIRFAVDEVEAVTSPLPTKRGYELLRARLRKPIEACHGYDAEFVAETGDHGLFDALHRAFAEHRPLILSPDAVWTTLLQGLGHHILLAPETWRGQLVRHEGRKRLRIERADLVSGSPKNPWPDVFRSVVDALRAEVGAELCDWATAPFSTSSLIEQAAFAIALMQLLKPYFEYELGCICGIPWIELRGAEADWADLQQRARRFRDFDLDWWCDPLDEVLAQFTEAAAGRPDLQHWRGIYKPEQSYGTHTVSGWSLVFAPYAFNSTLGRPQARNPVLTGSSSALSAMALPPGLCDAPIVFELGGARRALCAHGGIIGTRLNPRSQALEPIVGWAVSVGESCDDLAQRVVDDPRHQSFSPRRTDGIDPPSGLAAFRAVSDGAVLHVDSPAPHGILSRAAGSFLAFVGDAPGGLDGGLRLVPAEEVEGAWRPAPEVSRAMANRLSWEVFAQLGDGRRLAYSADLGIVAMLDPGPLGLGTRAPIVAASLEIAIGALIEDPEPFPAPFESWALVVSLFDL